jgi:hemoglobin
MMVDSASTDTTKNEAHEKPLYERLGGAYSIATAVDRLIENLHRNETLNNANEKVKAFHTDAFKAGYKFMVTAWVIEATGGPRCYPGRGMPESHRHLGLSQYEFDVTAHEIRNTLYQLGVPRKEIDEFMEIIDSYQDEIAARST